MPSEQRDQCAWCQHHMEQPQVICPACGMPVPLKRVRYFLGIKLDFKVFVIVLTVFCLAMIIWLPRTLR